MRATEELGAGADDGSSPLGAVVQGVDAPRWERRSWALYALVALLWSAYSLTLWSQDLAFPLPLFARLSWDEYQFLPVLDAYQRALLDEGVVAFAFRNEPFGYGSGFWQLYALWALPFAGFGASDDSRLLLWLRLPSLALQLASLALVLRTLEHLHPGRATWPGVFALVLLAPMSGLQLLYKPFSVDYLVVFATLVTVFSLARQVTAGRDARWWALAAIAFGFAVGSKPYAALAAPLVAFATARLIRSRAEARSSCLIALFGGMVGFFGANLYLFRHGFRGAYLEKLSALAVEMGRADYGHAIQPPGLGPRVLAWIGREEATYGITTTGLSAEFARPGVLVAIALATGVVLLRRRPRPFGVVVGATGLFDLVVIVLITNRVWTWYALTPMFLVAIGVGSLVATAGLNGRGRAAVGATGLLTLGAVLLLRHPQWSWGLLVVAAAVSLGWVAIACPARRGRMAWAALAVVHVWTQTNGLTEKARHFEASRRHPHTADAVRFYGRWVVPSRPLLARIEQAGFVVLKAWKTPVSTLLHERASSGLTLAEHLDDDVGAIVRVLPLRDFERTLADGFTSVCPPDEGVLLIRTDLLDAARGR